MAAAGYRPSSMERGSSRQQRHNPGIPECCLTTQRQSAGIPLSSVSATRRKPRSADHVRRCRPLPDGWSHRSGQVSRLKSALRHWDVFPMEIGLGAFTGICDAGNRTSRRGQITARPERVDGRSRSHPPRNGCLHRRGHCGGHHVPGKEMPSHYSAAIWMRARVASFKNVPEFSDRCLTKMFLSRS